MVGLSSDTSGLMTELSSASKTLGGIVQQIADLISNLSHEEKRPQVVQTVVEAPPAEVPPLPAAPARVPLTADLQGMLSEGPAAAPARGIPQAGLEAEEIEELESADD